jgi:septal ring factor EnvC (AmiA/AmiB activator)
MNKKLFYIIPLYFFICLATVISQSKKQSLDQQREKLQKEIDLTNKLLDETSKKKGNTINKVQLLGSKISSRTSLMQVYQSDLARIEQKISDHQSTINKLEQELSRQKSLYAEFIRYSYKNYNNYNSSMYLLASTDMNQFYMRIKYLEQLRNARKEKIVLVKRIKQKIASELASLEKEKIEKEKLITSLEREKSTLTAEKKSHEEAVKQLEKEESTLRKELSEKKRIEEEINEKIEALIKAETKKGANTISLTPEQKLISADFEKNRGRLPWPTIQGVVTDRFGEHEHPVIKNVKVRNNGIDITTVENENVRCVFNGEVSKIFAIKGANYTVIIRHGSYYTVYHNLTNVRVNVGDVVKTKDVIGKVSAGQNSQSAIVHFEVWKGLEKLNPEDWISK